MRVLVVSSYLPWPITYGAAVRTYNLVRHLARHAEVTLLCYGDSMTTEDHVHWMEQFARVLPPVPLPIDESENRNRAKLKSLFSRRSFSRMQFYSDSMQRSLNDAASRWEFDAVIVEQSFMGFFDLSAFAGLLVLDEHNVEYDLFRQTALREHSPLRKIFNLAEYRKFKREEIEIARRFDLLFYSSAGDAALISRDCAKPIEVIPNGVDTDLFSPLAQAEARESAVLYFGAMNYFPNADAVHYFVREMWPSIHKMVPHAQLRIVGPNPDARILDCHGTRNIAVLGTVPDIRPHLHAADVVVVPLRLGSGTRLKVLESLAAGKAIVTTSIGCEGIDVTSGQHLIIADAADEFCAATAALLRDAPARARLGDAGRRFVEENYSWSKIIERMAAQIRLRAGLSEARDDQGARDLVPMVPPAFTGGSTGAPLQANPTGE